LIIKTVFQFSLFPYQQVKLIQILANENKNIFAKKTEPKVAPLVLVVGVFHVHVWLKLHM